MAEGRVITLADVTEMQPPGFEDARSVQPTLIIGLGGTGGEVLLRLRRKFFEQTLSPNHPSVRYLYIDCDRDFEERALGDPRARPVKAHIAFGLGEKLLATVDSGFFDAFNANPGFYGHIAAWLPRELPPEVNLGAGAVRPIGRLTFFHNFKKITTAIADAYDSFAVTQRPGGGASAGAGSPRIIIISSLAGGTGGGIFLDLGFWLRHKYGTNCWIQGLFVLPDVFQGVQGGEHARSEQATRAANGYACLKELEYFHQRMDHHIRRNKGDPVLGSRRDFRVRWQSLEEKRDDIPPIPAPAYTLVQFISGKNEGGAIVGDHLSIFEMIAEYLYWDLNPGAFSGAARGNRVNLFSQAQRALFQVNYRRSASDRTVLYQDYFSERYMSFGLGRICFPTPRVRFLCAFSLVADMLRHWMREVDGVVSQKYVVDLVRREVLGSARAKLSSKLCQDLQIDADMTLQGRVGETHNQAIRSIEAAAKKGISRSQLDAVCEEILKDSRRQGEDRELWGKWPLVILKNQARVLRELKANLDKWVVDMIDKETYGPVRTRQILEQFISLVGKTARKEGDSVDSVRAAADREREMRSRTLQFYENTSSRWKTHPLRDVTLERLALRALRQAANEASLRNEQCAHEVCQSVLTDLMPHLQRKVDDLQAFLGRLIAQAQEVEDSRKALDEMWSQYVFEIDLYHAGDYKAYYRLRKGVPDYIKDFLAEQQATRSRELQKAVHLTTWDLVEESCRGELKDFGQRLFRFGLVTFRDLPGQKNAVEEFLRQNEGKDWEATVRELMKNARPWIRQGDRHGNSAARVSSQLVLGLPGGARQSELEAFFRKETLHRERLAVAETGEIGSIVLLEERSRFPITYMAGLHECKQHYEQVRFGEEYLGSLHLTHELSEVPDIVVKRDDEVRQEIECRRLILQAIMLGLVDRKVRREESGDEKVELTFSYRDLGLKHSKVYRGEADFARKMMASDELQRQLKQEVDREIQNLSLDKKRKLLKLLFVYQERTFPAMTINAEEEQEGEHASYFDVNRAAISEWYDALFRSLPDSEDEIMKWLEPDLPPVLESFAKDLGQGYWAFE